MPRVDPFPLAWPSYIVAYRALMHSEWVGTMCVRISKSWSPLELVSAHGAWWTKCMSNLLNLAIFGSKIPWELHLKVSMEQNLLRPLLGSSRWESKGTRALRVDDKLERFSTAARFLRGTWNFSVRGLLFLGCNPRLCWHILSRLGHLAHLWATIPHHPGHHVRNPLLCWHIS